MPPINPESEFLRLPTKLRRASLRGARRPVAEEIAPPAGARVAAEGFINNSEGSEGAPTETQALRTRIADLEGQLQDQQVQIEGLQTELETAKGQVLTDASKALTAWLSGPSLTGEA